MLLSIQMSNMSDLSLCQKLRPYGVIQIRLLLLLLLNRLNRPRCRLGCGLVGAQGATY